MAMRRRDFLFGTSALAALGGLAGGVATGIRWFTDSALPPRKPANLILLLADDMRWDAMGWMGNPYIRTPNLDALAGRSFCFMNNFVTTSICATSRASILTGQYARRHKIWDFGTPLSRPAMEQSFPWLLKQSGYHTGFIGKWGVGENVIDLARFMYDYYDAFPGQGDYFPQGPQRQHLTDLQEESAIRFLREAPRDQPFCLQVSFKAPHGPNFPARRFEKFYETLNIPRFASDNEADRAALPPSLAASRSHTRWGDMTSTDVHFEDFIKSYYRLISGIDDMLSGLLAELERLNLTGDTCILFTSDNGHMIGEHGLWGKWIMYEESMRVPLMLYVPPLLRYGAPQRRLVEDITLNIDVAPTLLAMAGLNPPDAMQGKSVLPLAYEQNPRGRDEMFYEHFYSSPPWPIVSCEGVRTREWKYTLYDKRDAVLFNLVRDPLEQHNLAAAPEHKGLCADMTAKIERYRTEVA